MEYQCVLSYSPCLNTQPLTVSLDDLVSPALGGSYVHTEPREASGTSPKDSKLSR